MPSGTLDAKKFIELISKSNGFSQATIEGCLQAVTDELQHWLKQGWIVEVGELGHFSLSLKCGRPVMEKKEIRSPSIHLNKINLRINKKFRESMEPLQLERMESPYRNDGSLNEDNCCIVLIQHLEEQGCITRADFMRLAGINRDKAIGLLNKYIEEGVIRKYGGGKTVVYLKK
ncbi:DNA-binding protein [Bacteroides ovatus]|nr:DNA-binding protein [Bacteroides ovatus]